MTGKEYIELVKAIGDLILKNCEEGSERYQRLLALPEGWTGALPSGKACPGTFGELYEMLTLIAPESSAVEILEGHIATDGLDGDLDLIPDRKNFLQAHLFLPRNTARVHS